MRCVNCEGGLLDRDRQESQDVNPKIAYCSVDISHLCSGTIYLAVTVIKIHQISLSQSKEPIVLTMKLDNLTLLPQLQKHDLLTCEACEVEYRFLDHQEQKEDRPNQY